MAAPVYSTTTQSNSPADWTTADVSTTRTTPSYSPAAGTILVGCGVSEDSLAKPISGISGGPTWTQQYLDNTTSKTSVALYTATAAGGEITSTITESNGQYTSRMGLAVLQFTGSNGIGAKNTASATTGSPSVSLTTTQNNSAVVMVVGDWAAVAGTSTFSNVNSTPVEVVDYADGANYGVHIAYWPDVGAAGAKTFAMSAPSGQNWTAQVIEVTGSAGGDVSVNVTGLSLSASLKAPTLSGIINRVDYIGASTPVEANNANLTLTEPAGVQEGDLLIAAIAHRGTIGYQKPSDWTSKLLDQSSGNTSTTTTASIASGELFYVVRGASAPTLTFTKETGTGDVARGTIIALRGQDTTTPIRASLQTTLGSNSATVVTGSGISPQAGDCVVGVWCGADNVTWSAEQINGTPTALVETIDSGSNTGADNSIAVAYLTITQESISNQTVQATASASSRHVVLVVDVAPMTSSVSVNVDMTGRGLSATTTVGSPTVAAHQTFTVGNLFVAATAGSISTVNAAASYTPVGRFATGTVGTVIVTAAASTTLSVDGVVNDPTFVNAVGAANGSSTQLSSVTSPALNTTSGNFLFGQVSHYTAGIDVSSAIDSAGNTWVKAGTTQGGDVNHDHEIWYTPNPIVGNANNVLTYSFTGAGGAFSVASQAQFSWTGAQSISFSTEALHALVSSTPVASSVITTATNDDLILGGYIAWTPPTELSNDTGTIAWADVTAQFDTNAAFAYRNTDAAGNYTIALTSPGDATYSVIAKAFKAVSASTALRAYVGDPTVSISVATNVTVTGVSCTASYQSPSIALSANATPAGRSASVTVGTPSVSVGNLTWSAYAGATSYRLYWGTTSASYSTGPIDVGNVLLYSLGPLGLPVNTTCYIKVRAWNGSSEIGDAASEFEVLNGVIFSSPFLVLLVSGLGATASRGAPSITMSANATLIGLSATSTAGSVTAVGTDSISVNLTGLSLTASRGSVAAAVYTFVSVTGLPATTTLNAPTVVASITIPAAGIALTTAIGLPAAFGGSLTWNASTDAISYRIYWGTTSGIYTQSLDVGNVLSYPLASLGLVRDTTYYSVIRAWGGSTESANSSEIILLNDGQLPTPYTLATLPGRALTATLGAPTARADVTAAPVGRTAAATLGDVGVQTSGNVTLTPASFALASATGAPTITAPVTVVATSQNTTLAFGSVVVVAQVFQSVVVSLVGLGSASARGNSVVTAAANATSGAPLATASIGPPIASVSAAPVIVSPAGLTSTRGSLAVTGTANVTPVGVAGFVQRGSPTISSASVVAITGNAAVATLNDLDIDVNSTVDYPAFGIGLASALGNLTVAIEGAISFSVAGVGSTAVLVTPLCVGTAIVPAAKFLLTSSLVSPDVSVMPSITVTGFPASATVGHVNILTDAGAALTDLTGLPLTATVAVPGTSISALLELPAGFYIVSSANNNLDYLYGTDVQVDGLWSQIDYGLPSLANDVAIFTGGVGAATGIGRVNVSQNAGGDINGFPLAARLGNPRVRTRNPHATWASVVVSGARSFFRPGRMW